MKLQIILNQSNVPCDESGLFGAILSIAEKCINVFFI